MPCLLLIRVHLPFHYQQQMEPQIGPFNGWASTLYIFQSDLGVNFSKQPVSLLRLAGDWQKPRVLDPLKLSSCIWLQNPASFLISAWVNISNVPFPSQGLRIPMQLTSCLTSFSLTFSSISQYFSIQMRWTKATTSVVCRPYLGRAVSGNNLQWLQKHWETVLRLKHKSFLRCVWEVPQTSRPRNQQI